MMYSMVIAPRMKEGCFKGRALIVIVIYNVIKTGYLSQFIKNCERLLLLTCKPFIVNCISSPPL